MNEYISNSSLPPLVRAPVNTFYNNRLIVIMLCECASHQLFILSKKYEHMDFQTQYVLAI